MTEYQAHYPRFDVMREEEHWDPHTREIVNKRLKTEKFKPFRFFSGHEGDTLFRLCTFLLDDNRTDVISYVVYHFDSTLQADIGESQRKTGVPKQSTLIRKGLEQLDQVCDVQHGSPFIALETPEQQQIVHRLMQDSSALQSGADPFPLKEWLDKVLSQAVSAYYSHPAVWSEIGYAGPAYPRGYVRSELGLTDPWEARRDGK